MWLTNSVCNCNWFKQGNILLGVANYFYGPIICFANVKANLFESRTFIFYLRYYQRTLQNGNPKNGHVVGPEVECGTCLTPIAPTGIQLSFGDRSRHRILWKRAGRPLSLYYIASLLDVVIQTKINPSFRIFTTFSTSKVKLSISKVTLVAWF